MEGLDRLNEGLRGRGVRLSVVQARSSLWLRGTLPQPDGGHRQQRISLQLKATEASLLEAETRALNLAALISSGAYPGCGVPWGKAAVAPPASSPSPAERTVSEWVNELETSFWAGKVRSSAAVRTWERLRTELRRLPQGATLTTDLMVAVAAQTKPGSRTRQESCKVFKRLGKLAGVEGLEQLDALRTPYEPAERALPSDEQLEDLLNRTRDHEMWGWCTAALCIYGCRPAETFSLTPSRDGTAKVLGIKRKNKLPAWRTALALPPAWVQTFDLFKVKRPWDCVSPATYDSLQARDLTQGWGKWLRRQMPGLQLYDIRHAWAVRSIRLNLNASLAAKTMGHSIAVHHDTYHQWLDQADIAAVAAVLNQ